MWSLDEIVFTAMLPLILVGIIGNIHVIIVYAIYYKKNNLRLYVVLLSIVDLTGCFSSTLSRLSVFEMYKIIPEWVSYPTVGMAAAAVMISMSLIVIIGVDRTRRVMKPLGLQITYTKAKLLCLVVCMIEVGIMTPAIVMLYYFQSYTTTDVLNILSAVFLTYECILCFLVLVCLLVNICMGVYMFRQFLKFGKLDTRETSSKTNINSIRARVYKRGARKSFVFLVMALVSCIAVIPRIIYFGIICSGETPFLCEISSHIQSMLVICIYVQNANHCINPIVYGLLDLQFRKKCFMLYKRCHETNR